jgi:hypothetical protein
LHIPARWHALERERRDGLIMEPERADRAIGLERLADGSAEPMARDCYRKKQSLKNLL